MTHRAGDPVPPMPRSPRRWRACATPTCPPRSPRRSTSAARRSRPRPGVTSAIAHFQRLLREPPSALVSGVFDNELEPLRPEATLAAGHHATSRRTTWSPLPVVDEDDHLLGAVTVDDVLDHLLPEDWRDTRTTTKAVHAMARERAARLAPASTSRSRRATRRRGRRTTPRPSDGSRADRPLHRLGAIHRLHDPGHHRLDRSGTSSRRPTCASTSTRSSS